MTSIAQFAEDRVNTILKGPLPDVYYQLSGGTGIWPGHRQWSMARGIELTTEEKKQTYWKVGILALAIIAIIFILFKRRR